MRIFLLASIVFASIIAYGQPRIDNIARSVDYPFSTVQITGVGFSSTAADWQVWFGSVKGTVVSSTTTSITATVPASARLSHVEVINIVTRRSAKSDKKFMPTFSGLQPFTNNFSSTSFTNADDIFDLCSCDFDGDGKPDMAGSKFKDGKSNIMMLRNTSTIAGSNSTINFAQTSITLAFPTFSVNCGDINGDGKPDLVASRGGTSTGNSIFVFQNTSTVGSISFSTPIQLDLAVGNFAKEMAIRDLNRDGRPEIIVTNGQSNILYIFENKLSTATIVATEFTRNDRTVVGAVSADGTLALETADLNGDGWPEIIVAPNANALKVYILINPANGTLAFSSVPNIPISGGQNINDIAIADFDNNGALDFVVADRSASGGKAFVYMNRGGMVFQSVNTSTGFAAPVAFGVDVADMNGDGRADFVISDRKFSAPEEVNIFINDGAATPGFTKSTITTTKASWFVKTADFDGDSKPDIAVTSTNNSTSFSIDVWRNRNCHQAVILNENPLTICSPQVKTLQAVPLQALTYSWTTGDATATSNVDVSDAGSVTLTTTGEGGACVTQASITIVNGGGSAPAAPTITAPSGVCAGNSLTLTTPAVATEYEWTGPNGFTSAVQNPPAIPNVTTASAGIYRLRVKTSGCYSDYTDKLIDVVSPESFTITGIGGNQVCQGQAATLSITASGVDYNFQWKQGTTNVGTNSNTFPIASAAEANQGSYTVELSHKTVSCNSTTNAFALDVLSAPVASFTRTPSLVCVGTSVAFNGAGSTVDGTAPTPIFAWTFGDAATGSGSTVNHTYVAALTNVSVSLTVNYTGVSGCSNISTHPPFNVSAATAPTISVLPDVTEICPNGSETVTLAAVGTFNSFEWSTGASTASIDVDVPDTYMLQTVDANGCIGNAEVVLNEKSGCSAGSTPLAPKVFTPNGDLTNDLWVITSVPDVQECSVNIFDARGRRVYETKSFPVTGWDGVANGKPVPDGTYYYVIGCPGAKPVTGSVLIVR